MLSKIRKKNKEIKAVEKENREPVDKKDIENLIKLVETADEIGCDFTLCLKLSIGEFFVDSDSFNSIKVSNTKQDGSTLIIRNSNMLVTTDTLLNFKHIEKIIFKMKFQDKNEE